MSKPETIHLVATLKAKEGKADTLRDVVAKIIPVVQTEPGCISYHLHVDRTDPDRMVMLETWESQAALDAHVAARPFQELKPKLEELLAEPLSLLFLERLA